jgi:hypothetical protein
MAQRTKTTSKSRTKRRRKQKRRRSILNVCEPIDLRATADLLVTLMQSTQQQVVDLFAGLPGAKPLHCGAHGDAVYVPGNRKDKVLLVAHYDTVWVGQTVKPVCSGTRIVSGANGVGIGADDRAGVAALWLLRKSGHSLLIVPDEEIGCKGSRKVADAYPSILAAHRFAVQFDRRGSHDIVCYDCDNSAFTKFLKSWLPGYREVEGSFSDICELCPAGGIAGVNLSIGFRDEHTTYETLDVLDFLRTVELTRAMLADSCPGFEYVDRWDDWMSSSFEGKSKSKSKKSTKGHPADDLLRDDPPQTWPEYDTLREAEWWCLGCGIVCSGIEIADPCKPVCPACGGESIDVVSGSSRTEEHNDYDFH